MAKKTDKWELKMHEARELRKKGSELLFDRVRLLCECYDDPNFRSWHAENETDEIDFLDEELSDVASSFLTLRAVLLANPERESWVKHNIRELIAIEIERQQAGRKKDDEEKEPRVTWKARALTAESECERLRAEVQTLKESLSIVSGSTKAT